MKRKATGKNKRPSLKINDFSIDWLSKDSHFLFDSAQRDAKKLKTWAKKAPFYSGHIYLFTSGLQKITLLSKEAFLISANSINKYLQCEPKKKWLIPLPLFHVAGLSVSARAFQGEYSFIEKNTSWNAKKFIQSLTSEKISYTSLVPAQVYDLIKGGFPPPSSLQFALVGGGHLETALYKKATALKWPLIPTYGMTEACSQIATAERASLKSKEFPSLKVLPHIKVKTAHGILHIKSPSLLTGYFCPQSNEFYDPKTLKGWFSTQDRADIKYEASADSADLSFSANYSLSKRKKKIKCVLIFKGRLDDQIKISGHLISLKELSQRLHKIVRKMTPNGEFCLTALPHKRKGKEVVLVTDSFHFSESSKILKQFNKNISSHKRAKAIYIIQKIPQTALFKVNKAELQKQLLSI